MLLLLTAFRPSIHSVSVCITFAAFAALAINARPLYESCGYSKERGKYKFRSILINK